MNRDSEQLSSLATPEGMTRLIAADVRALRALPALQRERSFSPGRSTTGVHHEPDIDCSRPCAFEAIADADAVYRRLSHEPRLDIEDQAG